MGWPKGVPRPKKVNGGGVQLAEVPERAVKAQAAALSGFDIDKLAAAIALGVVEGMKASKKEETRAKDERTESHRLRMRKQLSDDRENAMRRWESCSHMRSHPYSGTSRIAWATQSDGITRGTCMHCGCPFSPIPSELPDWDGVKSPRMLEWYKRMISVPMTAAQNDFVTGMVAAGNPA